MLTLLLVDLAGRWAKGAEDIRRVALPDDPLPSADAIVGVGHALNYLPDAEGIKRALIAIAGTLQPRGVLALAICDLEWGSVRRDAPNLGIVGDDWAIVSRFTTPSSDRFVREITTFVLQEDGSWRRDDERHHNVLIDTARVPELLVSMGVQVEIKAPSGASTFPVELKGLVGGRLV